jgi:predicted acyl esterase
MYDVNIANSKTGVMEGFNFDNTKEERGTIIPGTHYQKVYLAPGPTASNAGRFSFKAPAAATQSFTDLTMAQQISAPQHVGAPARPSTDFNTVTPTDGQGNQRPSTAQINYCDDRVVGVNRTTTTWGTYGSLVGAVDRPVDGRLMYISEPLAEDVQLSGTPVVHLNAAPTKATGNLTVALLEIGRIPRAAVRIESVALSGGTAVTVWPAENGAAAATAAPYGQASGRVGTSTGNFKYVTWGHTDIQNPSYDGKAWFQVPEQNYTPNYYFQTTALVPGKFYDYVVEMNPYNYVFEKGCRIAVMVYGTDMMASPSLDAASTGGLDVRLGDGSYIDIPLKPLVATAPVTLEVSSATVTPGDNFDITYSIKDNVAGFASFDFDIPFNSSIYTPVEVVPAALLSGGAFNYTVSGGVINIKYNSQITTENGDLFTVTYKAAKGSDAHSFSSPLNVKINEFTISPFTVYEQGVTVKAGTLRTYDYTLYLAPNKTKLVVGDTLIVDVMLVGGKNYTQVATEIAFDASQLNYLGHSNLQGWAAAVTKTAPNIIALRSVPGMNMVAGGPCSTDVKLVTLTFKATGAFNGESLDNAINFASILISPAGGVTGAITAPGKPADITWLKIGDAAMQANLLKFPNLWNVETGRTNAIFSNAANGVIVEEVWIEAPVDTDYDGKRDLMRAVIRRPIETLPERGGLLSPAVINMTPYSTTESGNLFTAVSTNPYAGFTDQGPAPTKFTHTAFAPRDYAVQGTGVLKNLDADGRASHWPTISGPENDISYTALHDVTMRRVGVGPEATVATHKELLQYDMMKRTATEYTDWHKTNFSWLPPARTPVSKQLNGTTSTVSVSSAGAFSAATFLPRGYAFIEYRITGGDYAEGYLQYGQYNEALAAAAVVDWLNGRVRGYTGPDGRVEVEAYWASGTAAASGTSYNGTCPVVAAVTGVEGLRTIWPAAPPTNSYNYYRENGLGYYPGGWVGEDLTAITMYCAGRLHNTASPVYPGASSPLWDTFWDWMLYNRYMQAEKSGDYNPFYEERNSLAFAADIRKDTGIVMFHGTNDGNVKFRHTGLYNEALKYYGVEVVKGIFHQGQHTGGFTNAGTWTAVADNVHAWLDSYLFGVNNGIADRVPNYQVQSNSDAYGNGTVVSSDVWPRATSYQRFYPQTGRAGALATNPPAAVSPVTYKDSYIPQYATFLAANYNTLLTNISNSATRRQYITNGVDLANGLWDNMMIHRGNGGALSANNINGWRNRLVGGLANTTTAWAGPSNRFRLSGTALPGTFSKTTAVEDRIMYLMPITRDFTISGPISVTAEIAADKNMGVISAMLIEWGPQVKVVALGSVDVRNPNPDRTIAFDVPGLANTAKGGSWFPNYTFQTADIVPGNFYSYTWEMDITEYIFRSGRDLGLIIYGSDPEFTFMTKDPTGFTVNLGPNTYITLPVVGAPLAAPEPVPYMETLEIEEEPEIEDILQVEADPVVVNVIDEVVVTEEEEEEEFIK